MDFYPLLNFNKLLSAEQCGNLLTIKKTVGNQAYEGFNRAFEDYMSIQSQILSYL